jgi:hypothetical protein
MAQIKVTFFSVKMNFSNEWINRIEPHPIWEGDFNIQNPFAYEIQQTGIVLI